MAADREPNFFEHAVGLDPDDRNEVSLSRLLISLKAFTDAISEVVSGILERYNSLAYAEASSRNRLDAVQEGLARAVEAAYTYAEHVCDLIWYSSNVEMIQSIRDGIERDDFAPLEKFVRQLLSVYLASAEYSCKKAESALKDVRLSALELATDCRRRGLEAKTKKNITRAVGGATLVVGTTTLVIAGACTFGIGTLAGLCVAAGGSAIFGPGIGVATYGFYSDFAKLEKDFSELSQLFDRVKSSASVMFDHTRKTKMYLESLSQKIAIVNQTRDAHEVRSCLTSAFERLCERLDGLETPAYREKLEATKETFRTRITELLGSQMNT